MYLPKDSARRIENFASVEILCKPVEIKPGALTAMLADIARFMYVPSKLICPPPVNCFVSGKNALYP
jgi:hypothetical protein